MSGCQYFSHIDLSDAYLQVEVEEGSQQLLTINTHKGLYQFTRLSPGIKSAPGAFQQVVDAMLAGLEFTSGYLDDVLVGGRTEEEHKQNLERVLSRLQEYGFTVRIEKCSFSMEQVNYLGQIMDGDGIRPDPNKVAAIVNMPPPHDLPSLRSYLGAVNYYAKYVPEMRKLRYPMDKLLKAGVKWEWNAACQNSFDRFKELLMSPLQYWALTLLLYNFDIQYVSTESFGYADLLSRLINNHIRPEEDYVIAAIELEQIFQDAVNQSLEFLPLTYKSIQSETRADPILQEVVQHVQQGWPANKSDVAESCQQFYLRRDGLSVISNCLAYGERLVIPSKFQKKVLQMLHKGHPGVERMRAVARSYVYWPGIDDSIAQLVRSCNECALAAKTNNRVKLESWPVPEKPWQRLHMDYAGPVNDWYYLVLVDAYTKWPEVIPTRRITTSATLEMLQGIFARFGMPETIVSDNGRQFVSEQFELFCDSNGILHLKTPPFHPQSNGLAERFVDTFKRTLKKITAGGESLSERSEGKFPAELLLGRNLRTSLDLLRPPTAYHKIENNKQDSQYNRKHGAKIINYCPKDLVWAKVYKNNRWKWEAGQVLERVGSVVYNVWLQGKNILIRSHCNQLRIFWKNLYSGREVQTVIVNEDLNAFQKELKNIKFNLATLREIERCQ
ncbi:uncharacterized protein K02A2.6-like [Armigeres subalbatus]|uniref:uncharacterized protein K02A2.6-like n=1 Tax=Armigeres subalbatus TaxID=124917 RepID=UPI002ED4D565